MNDHIKAIMITNTISMIVGSIAIAVACITTKTAWPLLAFLIIPQIEIDK